MLLDSVFMKVSICRRHYFIQVSGFPLKACAVKTPAIGAALGSVFFSRRQGDIVIPRAELEGGRRACRNRLTAVCMQ